MLSIKILSKISDKGKPWECATPTRNECELMPAILTNLLPSSSPLNTCRMVGHTPMHPLQIQTHPPNLWFVLTYNKSNGLYILKFFLFNSDKIYIKTNKNETCHWVKQNTQWHVGEKLLFPSTNQLEFWHPKLQSIKQSMKETSYLNSFCV